MHKHILILSIFATYFAVAGYGLYIYQAGILVSALVLFGVPAYALARYSHAPSVILTSVIVLSLGLACILESVAVISGLWVSQGIQELAIANTIQLEALLSFVLQSLFLVLLYELFFDDGIYTQVSAQTRLTAFFVFCAGLVSLTCIYLFFGPDQTVSYAYLFILVALMLSSISALGVYRTYSVRFFDKLVNFTALASFPLLVATVVSVANGHRLFSTSPAFATVELLSVPVPLEVFLLILVLPFLVATMYEVYLDDRR